jgi:hypothetical protein
MASSQSFEENARDCEAMAASAERASDQVRYQRMAAAWKRLARVDAWLERHNGTFRDSGKTGSAAESTTRGATNANGPSSNRR